LLGVFFADEFIEACPGSLECGIERPLGAIVGMNMEPSVGLGDARKSSETGRERETTDPGTKDCRREALAAAGNKIAPTKIDRGFRLLWPTQSTDSRTPKRRPNRSIRAGPRHRIDDWRRLRSGGWRLVKWDWISTAACDSPSFLELAVGAGY